MATHHAPTGTLETHFTEQRRYSVEEAHEERGKKNWWRRSSLAQTGVIAFMALIMAALSTQRKEVSYYYQVDKGSGQVLFMGPTPTGPQEPLPETIHLWISDFILTLRWISVDTEAMQRLWNQAKWRVSKRGRQQFLEYEQTHKPLEQRDPVRVDILTVIRHTKRTYDVRWRETKFDRLKNTQIGDPVILRGLLTFEVKAPEGDQERKNNPAGIFFDAWQWSKD